MAKITRSSVLVFVFLAILVAETSIKVVEAAVATYEDFDDVPPAKTGQEKAKCKAKKGCTKTLECPAQCPNKKPKQNKKQKGCHIDCSSRCEATCKCKCPNQICDTLLIFG